MPKRERTYKQWLKDTISIIEKLGARLYTFDPKWRHHVGKLADDLSKKFPHLEFEPIPGCLGEWPQINVTSIDEEF